MRTFKESVVQIIGLILIFSMNLATAQWGGYPNYVTYNPPTFSDLNSYTTVRPYTGQNVRIWPYVIGQYYYPYYYQNYNTGLYDNNAWNYYNYGYNTRSWTKK